MRNPLVIASPMMLLAACATTAPGANGVQSPASLPTIVPRMTSVERLMGQPARALTSLFGPASLDVHEETAQRLQFKGVACVLDAYLYPDRGREPIVTHIDARRPNGIDMDKNACVEALTKRH